ncbi:hypothetical protein N7478_005300 [Penicillium angulare]|uniref:uncharacterized protein n=1 Tax=Penicillium angulare TaxID=116970 RepID=UPI0025404FDB|nr:uncharacterized protein N7478_005300 [Penicillium angulare]KAJ5279928.1 hypothetical protein N7478_005300 [Penicillium angulare]
MSFFFGGYVEKHDNKFWCRICGEWFSNQEKILKHCSNTDKHEWCPTCERVFMTNDSLLQHQEDSLMHNICFFCPDQPDFSDDDDLQIHFEDDHHHCFDCNEVFDTDELLSAHNIAEHHGCPICGRGFNRRLAQESHMRSHAPRELKCPYCDRESVRFSSYLRHLDCGPCGSENRIYKLAFEAPGGYEKFYDTKWLCNVCCRQFDNPSGLFFACGGQSWSLQRSSWAEGMAHSFEGSLENGTMI